MSLLSEYKRPRKRGPLLPQQAVKTITLADLGIDSNPYERTASYFGPSWATNTSEYLKAFVDWMYIAIDTIAEKVAETEWTLYYDKTDYPEVEDSHPAYQLFSKPNLKQNWNEFIYLHTVYRKLVGANYWYVADSKPLEIHIFRPDNVTRQQGYISYNGHDYDPAQILTDVAPSPYNPEGTDGYSPIRAIAGMIQSYLGMRVAEFSTFRQSVINQVLVRMRGDIGSTARNEITAKIRQHLGANSAGRNLAIDGVEGVERIGLKPDDVINVELARNFRREILSSFKVPESILGIGENSNKSQGDNDRFNFVENAVRPVLLTIMGFLNNEVLPFTFPGQLVRAEPIIPYPDMPEEKRSQEAHDLNLGIRTVNEVREERGLETVAWGDEPLKLSNPLSALMGGKSIELVDEAANGMKELIADRRTKRQKTFDSAFTRFHNRWEMRFATAVNDKVFAPMQAYLIRQLNATSKGDENDNARRLADAMNELYDDIVINGGGREYAEAIARSFGLEFNFPKWRQAYNDFYAQRGVDFWTERITTGRQRTMAVIQDVAAGKLSFREGLQKIESEFGKTRAVRIARTEVTGAMNGGAASVYATNGIARKEWIATLDELTRETHIAANGQIVSVGDTFEVGGNMLQHPGDPNGDPAEIVNCRCAVAPVVE